jgi:2-polyprenyl-3-methyl-5-hydroxy-6-metoxy-1,4-benzoquinol methylase
MDPAFLLPGSIPGGAIEERYAVWQQRLLIQSGFTAPEYVIFAPDESASDVVAGVEAETVVVLTDPLLVPPRDAAGRLLDTLGASGAAAALPAINGAERAEQRAGAPVPYLTLRQFEAAAAAAGGPPIALAWDRSDPGLFACRTELLKRNRRPLREALDGASVVIDPGVYCHRYASLRGQLREDLLERVGTDARRILEFGCGEGALAAALKRRQSCRVVGIEMDPQAAAIASRHMDTVHRGDARILVDRIDETFDWIVGGDILEHLDDPWSFLRSLRRLAVPGGQLLLSLPNLAAWPVIADLLQGRFDYLFMGITCVGHLRFFTRRSIEEMLKISGWEAVAIEPQPHFITSEFEEFRARLDAAGVPYSLEDLITPGYYVRAASL